MIKKLLEALEILSTDKIMNDTLFLGTYPGLTKSMMDYEIETIIKFTKK